VHGVLFLPQVIRGVSTASSLTYSMFGCRFTMCWSAIFAESASGVRWKRSM
jgi:hypothetical protein